MSESVGNAQGWKQRPTHREPSKTRESGLPADHHVRSSGLAGQTHLKPSTFARYEGILRKQILPRWGSVALANVSHADVQAWVTSLSKEYSPATVQKVHNVLSLVLEMAVKDGRLSRNVVQGVNLPRVGRHEHLYLTHEAVEALANQCGFPDHPSRHATYDTRANASYRLVVLFLAYTGARFGEMAALKVARLDLRRGRAMIAESVTPIAGQGLVWGTPKNHQRREVPIPKFLVDELRDHVAGKRPDELVFASIRSDQPLRVSTFRQTFGVAASAIGMPGLHPHQLRHTAASLAIASGADVKVVQQMMGHSFATMTLDTYGHLFEDRLDEVAAAMDAARAGAQHRRHELRPLPRVARARSERKRRSGPAQRFRWSGPLFRRVPPTGFEPALPP